MMTCLVIHYFYELFTDVRNITHNNRIPMEIRHTISLTTENELETETFYFSEIF